MFRVFSSTAPDVGVTEHVQLLPPKTVLEVESLVVPNRFHYGETTSVTFNIVVRNVGAGPAEDVAIEATHLPNWLEVQDISIDGVAVELEEMPLPGISLGRIPAGSSKVITITGVCTPQLP